MSALTSCIRHTEQGNKHDMAARVLQGHHQLAQIVHKRQAHPRCHHELHEQQPEVQLAEHLLRRQACQLQRRLLLLLLLLLVAGRPWTGSAATCGRAAGPARWPAASLLSIPVLPLTGISISTQRPCREPSLETRTAVSSLKLERTEAVAALGGISSVAVATYIAHKAPDRSAPIRRP